MAIYGNNIYVLSEQQVLQEMNFSKKDLQDPNTLNKILKNNERNKKFANIGQQIIFYSALIEAITLTIGSIVIGLGPVGIIASILTSIGNYKLDQFVGQVPLRKFNKNMEKFRLECIKLREVSIKKMEQDPKNASKYKTIIENCDKTLQAIKDREKKLEQQKFLDLIESAKGEYNRFITFWNNPDKIDYWEWAVESEIFPMAQVLKISLQDLIKRFISKRSSKTFRDILKLIDEDNIKEIPNLPVKLDDECYIIGANDDNQDFVHGKSLKIYRLFFDNNFDILTYSDTDKDQMPDKEYMKALTEADKELGYYLLSKCPDGIEQRSLED